MVIEVFHITAALYLLAGLAGISAIALPGARFGRATRWLLAAGALLHGVAFARLHTLPHPPQLTDLPSAVSLAAWLAVIVSLLLLRGGRLEGLAVLVSPLAFLGVFYESFALYATVPAATAEAGSWPHLHVILASAGLALLGVAGLAGALFLAEDRALKSKRIPALRRGLPSLEALDRVNAMTIATGFPLLTCGVIAGMLWTRVRNRASLRRRCACGVVGDRMGDLPGARHRAFRRRLARSRGSGERRARLRLPALRRDRRRSHHMKILLVGMNHRTAPVEVRERFAVDDPLPWLVKLVAAPEIEEAVLISTCNRVEVIAAAPNLDAGRHRLRSFFHRDLGQGAPLVHQQSENAVLYEHVGDDAVRHLFRVSASIDSLVVGEPQILGQVKEAYRLAAGAGACGPLLNRLFASAFASAKRVRSETQIASRPVSVARVAVDLARQIFETLEDKRALLVGAGEMSEVALDALRGAGLAGVAVANRTRERAAELAARFGATAHGLDELPQLLAVSDVVLTSIGVDRPLLDAPLFEAALRTRRRRPIFAIDLGVPRNIDPIVNQLDDVYLYDVDDLGGVAEANAEERRRETVHAEAIVQEEVERFGRLALGAAGGADDPAAARARRVDPPGRTRQGDRRSSGSTKRSSAASRR